MKRKLVEVKNFSNGLSYIPQLVLDTKQEMPLGTLIAINDEGKAVPATCDIQVDDKAYRAIGIVYKSSPQPWGAGFTFNVETEILGANEGIHIYREAHVTYPDVNKESNGTYREINIGDSVYLGKNGVLTTIKPTKTATKLLLQKVGVIADAKNKVVELFLFSPGTIIV